MEGLFIRQFGFRKEKSTIIVVKWVIGFVKISVYKWVAVIYLDIKMLLT